MREATLRDEEPVRSAPAGHPRITRTALRAIFLSSERGMPVQARIAMEPD